MFTFTFTFSVFSDVHHVMFPWPDFGQTIFQNLKPITNCTLTTR